jgi:hypothetical protein
MRAQGGDWEHAYDPRLDWDHVPHPEPEPLMLFDDEGDDERPGPRIPPIYAVRAPDIRLHRGDDRNPSRSKRVDPDGRFL